MKMMYCLATSQGSSSFHAGSKNRVVTTFCGSVDHKVLKRIIKTDLCMIIDVCMVGQCNVTLPLVGFGE